MGLFFNEGGGAQVLESSRPIRDSVREDIDLRFALNSPLRVAKFVARVWVSEKGGWWFDYHVEGEHDWGTTNDIGPFDTKEEVLEIAAALAPAALRAMLNNERCWA